MAALASLTVSGAATFAAPGTDPNSPMRLADFHGWTATKPTSKTAAGAPGQYHCDGVYLFVCYATNSWARTPVALDWTP